MGPQPSTLPPPAAATPAKRAPRTTRAAVRGEAPDWESARVVGKREKGMVRGVAAVVVMNTSQLKKAKQRTKKTAHTNNIKSE